MLMKKEADQRDHSTPQATAAEEPAAESTFIERWAYYVREMGNVSHKPDGLDGYFSQLFDASNRRNIEERKLTIT